MRMCAKCGEPAKPGQGYCKDCHRRYMRKWRAQRRFHVKHAVVAAPFRRDTPEGQVAAEAQAEAGVATVDHAVVSEEWVHLIDDAGLIVSAVRR